MVKLVVRQILNRLPDRLALTLYYVWTARRFPDLKSPKRFSEKQQARKLGTRDPRLPALADKITVKDFVRAKLGDEWLIPTLWTGKELPSTPPWEPPFIVKANHGSGWAAPFRPGDTHWPSLVEKAEGWLRTPYSPHMREWHYARIEPCLLVEPFIGDASSFPVEYKFLTFNGRVEFIQCLARTGLKTFKTAHYNRDWERQPFGSRNPIAEPGPARPASLDAMLAAAERLAEGFDYVRLDFYEVDGKPKFSEMTFFPGSGFVTPIAARQDVWLGEVWRDFRP